MYKTQFDLRRRILIGGSHSSSACGHILYILGRPRDLPLQPLFLKLTKSIFILNSWTFNQNHNFNSCIYVTMPWVTNFFLSLSCHLQLFALYCRHQDHWNGRHMKSPANLKSTHLEKCRKLKLVTHVILTHILQFNHQSVHGHHSIFCRLALIVSNRSTVKSTLTFHFNWCPANETLII